MLHITNGESVAIAQTGLAGQVLFWNDILHDGPVPIGLRLQESSRVRERFIAEFFGVPHSEVSFERRDEAITRFRDHEEVVLWFEHDLFDQLQLIQILDWFSPQDRAPTRISLISVERYLGPMPPEQLVPLFATRHTVTVAEFETAQTAWTAFCSPDPTELVKCSARICPPCPFLSRALLRHSQQFPALRNGLSRAEQHIVALIDSGLQEFSELFPTAQKLEERIWMGDATFLQVPSRIGERMAAIVASSEQRFESKSLSRLVLNGQSIAGWAAYICTTGRRCGGGTR
jgi:hypothetical protein